MMYCGKFESAGWMGLINKAADSGKTGQKWSQEYYTVYKFPWLVVAVLRPLDSVTISMGQNLVQRVWLKWDIRLRVEPKLIHH